MKKILERYINGIKYFSDGTWIDLSEIAKTKNNYKWMILLEKELDFMLRQLP